MTEPAKAEKQERKKTLSNTDGDLLERYFCQYKSAFSRSITGPMLDKAELYSSGTYPCWWCYYIIDKDGKRHNSHSPGIRPDGQWCEECNGTGFLSLELEDEKELTARPTAEVVEAKGFEPDHGMLQDYGRISRRLDKVKEMAGRLALKTLEEYHGDTGAKWGRTRWGRIFSIYPLTASGRRLLIRILADDKTNEVLLTPVERLGVQAELQRVKPQDWRQALLGSALVEAEALYQTAVDAWILTAPARPAKPVEEKPRREKEEWVPGTPAKEFYGEDGRSKLREVVGRE